MMGEQYLHGIPDRLLSSCFFASASYYFAAAPLYCNKLPPKMFCGV